MVAHEAKQWLILPGGEDRKIITLVVDDSGDDELTSVIARGDTVPSPNFGGVWGNGERNGNWLVGFRLIELGGGMEREWFTDKLHRPLLDAILEVPHFVAIMPEEIANDASTEEDFLLRLGGSLIIQVDDRSPQVAEVLAERGV